MRLIDTEIEIAAPSERVWAVLTDFARYPEWNPYVLKIDGLPRTGERLQVTQQLEGRTARTHAPCVIAVERGRTLRWFGRLLLPRIFDGERGFSLQPLPAGGTRFRHQEIFEGILVPWLGGTFQETEKAFHRMNAALKRQSEVA